jgi:glycine/D-amino acid oxidase-like deaminating enzyme
MTRVPSVRKVGIKSLFCGPESFKPESFKPDNAPIVGEAPYLRNYFVAAGMNSVGFSRAEASAGSWRTGYWTVTLLRVSM